MARVPGSRPLSTRPDVASDPPIINSVIPNITLSSSLSTPGNGSRRVHTAGPELGEERFRARRHRLWTKSPLTSPSNHSLQGHTIAAEYWNPSGCVSPRRRGKDTDFLRLTPSGSLPANLPLEIPQGNREDSDVQGSFMYQIRRRRTEHASSPLLPSSSSMPSPTVRSRTRHSPYVSHNQPALAPISTTNFRTTYSNKHLHKIDARTRSRECKVPTSQSLPLPHRLRSGAMDIGDVYRDVERNDKPLSNDSTISKGRQRVSHLVIPTRASTSSSHHVYTCSSFGFEPQYHDKVDVVGFQLQSRPTSRSSSQSSLGIPLVKPSIRPSTSSSPPFFSHPPFHRSILPSSSYSSSPTDSFFDTSSITTPPYYHFMGTIGQGSYGKVLLGYRDDNLNQELCAVKVLPRRHIRRFGIDEAVKELTTLRLLAHTMQSACKEDGERAVSSCRMGGDKEGIQFMQKLVESFQDPGYIFIVLEYHPTSLANPETASRFRLAEINRFRSPTFSTSVSLPITLDTSFHYPQGRVITALRLLAAELTLGLLFLHKRGLVHQDLKPANIMISAEGHAVIGDFGAAASLPILSEEVEKRLPRYGTIVLQPEDTVTFTPLYAAPEILERNKEGLLIYDERIDWWSLGVLLYELSTGGAPFRLTGGGANGPLRRSEGDASLVYGLLEKLSTVGVRPKQDPQFSRFIKDLLIQDPNYRLSGPAVKLHAFYDPIQASWEDILALQYPPCPNPLVSPIDASDTSVHFTSGQEHFEADDPDSKQDLEGQEGGQLGSHSSVTLSSFRSVSPTSSHLAATMTTTAAAGDSSRAHQAEDGQVGSDGNRTNSYTASTNPLDVDSLFSGAALRETQLRKVDNLPHNCEQQRLRHQAQDDPVSFLDLSTVPSYRDRVVVSSPPLPSFLSSPITRRSGSCWPLCPVSSSPKPRSMSPPAPPSPSRLFTVLRSVSQSNGHGHGRGHHYGLGKSRYPGRGSSPVFSFGLGAGGTGQFEQTWLGGLADVFEEDEVEMDVGEGIARTTEVKRKGAMLAGDGEQEPWFDDSGIILFPLTTPPRYKKIHASLGLSSVGRGKEVETDTDAEKMATRAASPVIPTLYDSRRDSMHYDYGSQSSSEYGVWVGDDDQDHERASYSDDERLYEDEDVGEARGDENQPQFTSGGESEEDEGEEKIRSNDDTSVQTTKLPDPSIATSGNRHSVGSSDNNESSGSSHRDSPIQEKPHQKHSERRQDQARRNGLNSDWNRILRSEFNDSGLFIPVDFGIEAPPAAGVAGGSGTNGVTFPGLVVSRHIYDQLEASLDQEDGWAGCSQHLSLLAEQVTKLRSSIGARIKTGNRGMDELMGDGSSQGSSSESNGNDVSTTGGHGPGSHALEEGSVIDSRLSSSGPASTYNEHPTEMRNLEPQLWDSRRRRRFEKDIEVVFNSPDTPGPTVDIKTEGRRELKVRRRSGDFKTGSPTTEHLLQIEKYDKSVNKKQQVPTHAREWTLEEKITISILEAMDRRDRRIVGPQQEQEQQHHSHHHHHHHHHIHHHHHHYHHDHATTKPDSPAIASRICDCPECKPPGLRSCTPSPFNPSSLYIPSSSGSTSGWTRRYNAAAHMFYRFGAPSPGAEDSCSNIGDRCGRFWRFKKGKKLMKFKQRKEVLTTRVRQVAKRAWKRIAFW